MKVMLDARIADTSVHRRMLVMSGVARRTTASRSRPRFYPLLSSPGHGRSRDLGEIEIRVSGRPRHVGRQPVSAVRRTDGLVETIDGDRVDRGAVAKRLADDASCH